jgi:hypothetical protein
LVIAVTSLSMLLSIISFVIKEITNIMLYGVLGLFWVVLLVSGQKVISVLPSCYVAPKDLLFLIQHPELTSG